MTSTKVPSTVVPIDVSGQPFSRMASFRRSLIQVDFFIRRKKKDKRRNTVTEGDTKDLKDAFYNMINGKRRQEIQPNSKLGENSDSDIEHNLKAIQLQQTDNEEKNNNSGERRCSVPASTQSISKNQKEKNKSNGYKNEKLIVPQGQPNADTVKPIILNKRKLKSHIPISTVSAAMNVAVEMRELTGKGKSEDQSSSGNWSYSSDASSSDSENRSKPNGNMNKVIIAEFNQADGTILSRVTTNRSPESTSDSERSSSKKVSELTELSSYNSSETNTGQDDLSSNATSAESEIFFMSSDDSDEETSDLTFDQNYGSSLSLSTISNGSLNSLLSQTGTEMASSTGTLTSIGIERLPTPPPPPPALIAASAREDELSNTTKDFTNLDDLCHLESLSINSVQNTSKSSKMSKNSQNSLKPKKSEKCETKNTTEKSKNLFSSIVRAKSRTKLKNSENKVNKLQNQPCINMYGNSSPQTFKQIPSFIKENVSPQIVNECRSSTMESFSAKASKPNIDHKHDTRLQSSQFQAQHNSYTSNNTKTPQAVNSRDNNSDMKKVGIPLKYVHKVTVTPIQRQPDTDRYNSIAACRKSLFKDDVQQSMEEYNNGFRQTSRTNSPSGESNDEMFQNRQKAQRPMTLQRPRSSARVLLDPEGRVIQCTNSLDRKPYTPPENCTRTIFENTNSQHPQKIRTSLMNGGNSFCHWNGTPYPHNPNSYFNTNAEHNYNNSVLRVQSPTFIPSPRPRSDAPENKQFYSSFKPNSTQIHSPNQTSRTAEESRKYNQEVNRIREVHAIDNAAFQTQMIPTVSHCYYNTQAHSPDPNISGLPTNETTRIQCKVDIPSKERESINTKQIEKNHVKVQENPSTVFRSSLSPLSSEMAKPQQSSMSTEDLFAVIHNYKKRMNIKTDSDISLASSSRSNSPSYSRQNSFKGTLAETGFLSPRNLSSLDSSRDRRSWADFRPSNGMSSERKSLASDRLGPTKPTSMHDFKMLLLQTRSNSQAHQPRKSAVEMLKISTPDTASNDHTTRNSTSYSVPNSPYSDTYLYNGHSTVPFKRNTRARSSLQCRYTMYPPIFEDCSEDSETVRDAQLQRNVNSNICENIRVWL